MRVDRPGVDIPLEVVVLSFIRDKKRGETLGERRVYSHRPLRRLPFYGNFAEPFWESNEIMASLAYLMFS
ncbi:hypothetical protein EVAR_90342_1 [Eumeta japonica]|uniref:Uncharacterized protein n=1 Tax=Eumeta variegata TaxID=151549 RepID=A0A4C1YIT0_EUMVA|nr:hypothetical protein EVAR_90342_1 [Eumeta japonica]